MSPNSSLVDIGIEASRVDPRQLSCLVPEEVDPTVAGGRKLRQFDFQKNMLSILEPANQDMSVCYENLDALLRLLSRQLPYLHSIGVSMRSWTYYKRLCCPRNSTKESANRTESCWDGAVRTNYTFKGTSRLMVYCVASSPDA
jgi:hypothetical protein